jgi:hypothetical protein
VAGCGSVHQISPAALDQVSAVLYSMALNENMVSGVRDALLDADEQPGGVRSMDTDAVVQSLAVSGVAQNLGPIHVEPGVFMGVPPTSGFVDDPICAANGNFVEVTTDLSFPGWSAVLDVVRTHNSLASERIGAFGPGWTSALDLRVTAPPAGVVRVHLADGAVVPFVTGADGLLRSVGSRDLTLEPVHADQDHSPSVPVGWTLREGHVRSWTFDAAGPPRPPPSPSGATTPVARPPSWSAARAGRSSSPGTVTGWCRRGPATAAS